MAEYNVEQHPNQSPARPSSELALIALITGIVGLIFWPFSIAAVITGHIAHARIARGSGETGRNRAVAGIIMGWIGVAFGAFVLVSIIVAALI